MSTTTTAIQGSNKPAKTDWGALLSPLTITLGALLALQLLLALALEVGGRDLAPSGSQGPLLAFDPEKVTAIRVQDTEGEPVLVEKTESGWVIPSLGNLSAGEHKVTSLISKLKGLQKGLPVSTSEEALARFKVADRNFERKLTLERGDKPPVILYLGDSPGFRRLFVRAEGDSAVYDVQLGLFDAPDKADAWSDRTLLHLDAEKVRKLTFAGLTLERKDDGWRLADLAEGEEQDEAAIEDKVRALTNIDFVGVSAGEQEPAVDKEAEPVEIEATLTGGDTLRYRIAKLAEGNDYLLTVSNRPQRFILASYEGEELTGIERANLLENSTKPTQNPPGKSVPAGAVESGSAEPAGETAGGPAEEEDVPESGSADSRSTQTQGGPSTTEPPGGAGAQPKR